MRHTRLARRGEITQREFLNHIQFIMGLCGGANMSKVSHSYRFDMEDSQSRLQSLVDANISSYSKAVILTYLITHIISNETISTQDKQALVDYLFDALQQKNDTCLSACVGSEIFFSRAGRFQHVTTDIETLFKRKKQIVEDLFNQNLIFSLLNKKLDIRSLVDYLLASKDDESFHQNRGRLLDYWMTFQCGSSNQTTLFILIADSKDCDDNQVSALRELIRFAHGTNSLNEYINRHCTMNYSALSRAIVFGNARYLRVILDDTNLNVFHSDFNVRRYQEPPHGLHPLKAAVLCAVNDAHDKAILPGYSMQQRESVFDKVGYDNIKLIAVSVVELIRNKINDSAFKTALKGVLRSAFQSLFDIDGYASLYNLLSSSSASSQEKEKSKKMLKLICHMLKSIEFHHVSTQLTSIDQLGFGVELNDTFELMSSCVEVVLGHRLQSREKMIPVDIKNALRGIEKSCHRGAILLHRLKKAIDDDDPVVMNEAYTAMQSQSRGQTLSRTIEKIYTVNISEAVYGVGSGINNSEVVLSYAFWVKSSKCIQSLLRSLTVYVTHPATQAKIEYALDLLNSDYSGYPLDHWIDDEVELGAYQQDLLLIRQNHSIDFTFDNVAHGELAGYAALKALCHANLENCRIKLTSKLRKCVRLKNRLALEDSTGSRQKKTTQKRQSHQSPLLSAKRPRHAYGSSSSHDGTTSSDNSVGSSSVMASEHLSQLRLQSPVSSGGSPNENIHSNTASQQMMAGIHHSLCSSVDKNAPRHLLTKSGETAVDVAYGRADMQSSSSRAIDPPVNLTRLEQVAFACDFNLPSSDSILSRANANSHGLFSVDSDSDGDSTCEERDPQRQSALAFLANIATSPRGR